MKKGTTDHYASWYRILSEYFGGYYEISEMSEEEAEKFKAWCLKRLSPASVSRGIRTCRTIFRYALKRGFIYINPFEEVKSGKEINVARQYYVRRETIDILMKVCRNDRERLAIALGRFAGLRVPSEIRGLRFRDFKGERIRIADDTKTGAREVPLFHEVREIFERLKGRPNDFVFEKIFNGHSSAWKILKRIIEKACVDHWPKLWINMRSSCITDYDGFGYGEKTLDAVFGNSEKVRKAHYVQFQKEKEYEKMLEDNRSIVEYLRSLGGSMEDAEIENLLRKSRVHVKNLVDVARDGEIRRKTGV